jgi:DNA polymerase-1
MKRTIEVRAFEVTVKATIDLENGLLTRGERSTTAGIHDIAIREALIDIARGMLVEFGEEGDRPRYSLAMLTERHLGIDLTAEKKSDAWRKRYALLETCRSPVAVGRARLPDARRCAHDRDLPRQEGQPNLHDEGTRCAPPSRWRADVRCGAAHRTATASKKLRARSRGRVDRRARSSCGSTGSSAPTEPKDTKRLRELVTAAYGGDPPKTPRPRRADRHRPRHADRVGDPVLEKLRQAREERQVPRRPTSRSSRRGSTSAVEPQFNVLVATTRVSSDAQQFPQRAGCASAWEARLGYCLLLVDYGGLELRTMAQRAIWTVGFSKMAEALNAGLRIPT